MVTGFQITLIKHTSKNVMSFISAMHFVEIQVESMLTNSYKWVSSNNILLLELKLIVKIFPFVVSYVTHDINAYLTTKINIQVPCVISTHVTMQSNSVGGACTLATEWIT